MGFERPRDVRPDVPERERVEGLKIAERTSLRGRSPGHEVGGDGMKLLTDELKAKLRENNALPQSVIIRQQ